MKITHLDHLEDNILNDGSQGGKEAVAFLRSLGDMLDQGASEARVTVKWDGAPAIICGVNPDNGRFFVGTKSVFNKVSPKISYSENDVDNLYPPGQLAEKLKMHTNIFLPSQYQTLCKVIYYSLMISMKQKLEEILVLHFNQIQSCMQFQKIVILDKR